MHLKRPLTVTAISLFFAFGTLMSALAALMLYFPGGVLEPLWRVNPHAEEGFAVVGVRAVFLLVLVSVACATAAVGLWRCARWGYITAIVILSINLVGDTISAFVTHDLRTLIGLPIGGAMIAYLGKERVFVPRQERDAHTC